MHQHRAESPFTNVLGDGCGLALPLRRQYLGDPCGRTVVFDGALDRAWRRHRWLAPLFALSARWRLLFADTGEAIPARMTVRSHHLRDGRPAQLWLRTFQFTNERRFDALMTVNRGGDVIERMGPGRRIEARWKVAPSADGSELRIHTTWIGMCLLGMNLPFPSRLGGRVEAVERALDDDTIHIDLKITNPILGDVFGYSGTFRVSVAPGQEQQ